MGFGEEADKVVRLAEQAELGAFPDLVGHCGGSRIRASLCLGDGWRRQSVSAPQLLSLWGKWRSGRSLAEAPAHGGERGQTLTAQQHAYIQ